MSAHQIAAVIFALIFVVVFILANWRGNQFLELSFRRRLLIAGGIWIVFAGLVVASRLL